MSILPKPTAAPKPRSPDVSRIALFYAFILTVFAVTQLFSFESFLELLTTFGFPWGHQGAYIAGSLLVTAEVFAIPFLLRMSLSPAFRWFSMMAGWLVPLVWLKISLWLVFTDRVTDTVGFLGTVVNVMPGWWAVFVSIALGILAGWTSWGMWPKKRKK